MSPRSALIHSQRSEEVCVNSVDRKTKWERKVRKYSTKIKFSAIRASCLSTRPQWSAVNYYAASERLLSRLPWEGSMEKKRGETRQTPRLRHDSGVLCIYTGRSLQATFITSNKGRSWWKDCRGHLHWIRRRPLLGQSIRSSTWVMTC